MKNKKIICGIIIAILIAVIIIGIIAIKNNKKLLSKKNETNTKETTTIAKATEHEIYQTERSENSWAIDPRDPKNLLKLDGILLKIKYKKLLV